MTRRMMCAIGVVLGGLMLASCSGGGPDGSGTGFAGPAIARTNEIIVALQSDGKSLDPHTVNDAASMRLIENMYDTLLRYAEAYGEVEPGLAESWSLSDDHMTYRFTLRTNAFFHASGRLVTADDVKYSLERIRQDGARAFQFEPVDTIRTPDSHTVEIVLNEPFAPFLTYLAHPMSAVVDRTLVESEGLDRADGGSGPFRLVEWKKDQKLVLARHDGYFDPDLPYLDRVTFRPIPDETARTTALRNGEVDIILDVAAKDIGILEKAEGIRVESVPGTFWEYIGLNCSRKPFSDVRVRQAVAHAVDRSMINQLVKFSRATELTGGHIPPNHWAYAGVDLYPEPNPEQAKALLTEAGYPEGFDTTLIVGSEFAYQVKAAEVVKQQLREVGIRVTVRSLESGVFFNALGKHEFDMTIVGWLGFVDPDEWTYNLFHTGARWNQQVYSNDDVDRLLDEGRRLIGHDARKPIYDAVQRIVADEAPMVFLYVNDRTAAMLESVQGFDVHPTVTTISLRDTRRRLEVE